MTNHTQDRGTGAFLNDSCGGAPTVKKRLLAGLTGLSEPTPSNPHGGGFEKGNFRGWENAADVIPVSDRGRGRACPGPQERPLRDPGVSERWMRPRPPPSCGAPRWRPERGCRGQRAYGEG